MLAISFSHAVTDKTLCETGVYAAERIVKEHSLKPGEPISLSTAMLSLTIQETLWCLRAVKPSQRKTAEQIAWEFVLATLDANISTPTGIVEYVMSRKRAPEKNNEARRKALHDYYTEQKNKALTDRSHAKAKLILAVLGEECPSQIAVNVSQRALEFVPTMGVGAPGEETRQRASLLELLVRHKDA